MLSLHAIKALRDNYIWCLEASENGQCIIVDPGESEPVIDWINRTQNQLLAILITHHHWDHTHGIGELVKHYNVPVYGPNNPSISGLTHRLKANDSITFSPMDLSFTVMEIPGHTLDHIAYLGNNQLFCGDTLFSAGCGRLFEGTPEQMMHSLQQIKQLPADTMICCAHEYTLDNLRFTQWLDPHNPHLAPHIALCQQKRNNNQPTLPVALGVETALNPFLRCESATIKEAAQRHCGQTLDDPLAVFTVIREMKNKF